MTGPAHRPGSPRSLRLSAAVAATASLASACYLPASEVVLPLENMVLVAVYRCSETVVAGEVINDNDVPIQIVITPRWMDAQRVSFHEVAIDPIDVPPGSTVEWEAEAGAEIARPQFCEAETVAIDEAG